MRYVSLVSVLIAVIALFYSGWRNETTEVQRSLRTAGFAMLEVLAKFEAGVFVMAYTPEGERKAEVPYIAWAHAREISATAKLLPDPVPAQGEALFEAWSSGFSAIDGWDPDSRESRMQARQQADQISDQIDALRESAVQVIANLH